jgi:isochorismate pyruvate lyase
MIKDGAHTPENCSSMADVRHGVDETDTVLLQLLATRFAYMQAAARIKSDRDAVRDEERKAEVIANVVSMAKMYELPEEAICAIWDMLVEASIDFELQEWDRLRR